MPPPLPKPVSEMKQEWKYREARREKDERKKLQLARFNHKYQKKYHELELKVDNLAKEGSSYGKYIKQR